MNLRVLTILSACLFAACGGRVDASDGNAHQGVGGSDTPDAGDDGATSDSGATTPTSPPDDGKVYESPFDDPSCRGTIATGDVCRARASLRADAAADCEGSGLVLVYFETGVPCADGARQAKYTCCDASAPRFEIVPSTADCPATPDVWPPESSCSSDLWCNYPDACGDVLNWHCKYGRWEQNSGAACGK